MVDILLFQKYPIKSTVKFYVCFVKRGKATFRGFHRPRFLERTAAISNSEKITK